MDIATALPLHDIPVNILCFGIIIFDNALEFFIGWQPCKVLCNGVDDVVSLNSPVSCHVNNPALLINLLISFYMLRIQRSIKSTGFIRNGSVKTDTELNMYFIQVTPYGIHHCILSGLDSILLTRTIDIIWSFIICIRLIGP